MLELTTLPRAPKEVNKEGYIPAVFYGAKTATTPVFISSVDFIKVFGESGETATIALATDSGVKNVLVHDIQRHPIKNNPIHVDFYVVEKGQKVHVAIPLDFTGESLAVKNGGVLVKVLHEVTVEGESAHLPQFFVVDISALSSVESIITAKDIKLPKGVTLYHTSEDEVIASVSNQGDMNLEEMPALDFSSIEVEKKGKKEEEEIVSE